MKAKNFLFIPLIILIPLFSIHNKNVKAGFEENKSSVIQTSRFIFGSMQSYSGNMSLYDAAGFNTAHLYIGTVWDDEWKRHVPVSYFTGNDGLKDAVPQEKLREKLKELYDNHNGSTIFWQRPKIEWLAYGQSSIYDASNTLPSGDPKDDYWFYSFNLAKGRQVTENDHNKTVNVLYCQKTSQNANMPDTVLAKLKTNTEQCRLIKGDGSINQWVGDSECDWLIKPRMRIDRDLPKNDPEMKVCKVRVLKEDGITVLLERDIKAKNFKNKNGTYDGSYIENFSFAGEDNALTIKGEWGSNWGYSARSIRDADTDNNRSDIQVYWYNNCDLWIDYVKVENDVASDLLNNDGSNKNHEMYQRWIEEEVAAVKDLPYVNNFYIELFEFNNVPCIAYLNRKIDSLSGGRLGLMGDLLGNYQYLMTWDYRGSITTPEKLKRMYFDVTGGKEIFLGDPYPFTAGFPPGTGYNPCGLYSRIPNTLPQFSGKYILAQNTSPENYDAWLQSIIDTACYWYETGKFNDTCHPLKLNGVFTYLLKRGNAVSRMQNIPYIAMLQAHQWMSDFEVDREPTNEELDLMTNMAVAYGAKGIMYWWLPSSNEAENTDKNYSFGLTGNNDKIRKLNVYGQDKWSRVLDISKRINTWGPLLMQFDNRETYSYIYRYENERNMLLGGSYFANIITFSRSAQPQGCVTGIPKLPAPAGLNYECEQQRFIQVSTFKKEGGGDEYYFMIINKRCSPQREDHNDGERYIRAELRSDSPFFKNAGQWKVVEILSGDTMGEFNNNEGIVSVNLNYFAPGEGRIYKIIPAK